MTPQRKSLFDMQHRLNFREISRKHVFTHLYWCKLLLITIVPAVLAHAACHCLIASVSQQGSRKRWEDESWSKRPKGWSLMFHSRLLGKRARCNIIADESSCCLWAQRARAEKANYAFNMALQCKVKTSLFNTHKF